MKTAIKIARLEARIISLENKALAWRKQWEKANKEKQSQAAVLGRLNSIMIKPTKRATQCFSHALGFGGRKN